MLELNFFSELDCGSYIISIAKTASKKIGALIRSTKFLSSVVALYLYKSIIVRAWGILLPCLGCKLELLDKLQKRICRTVGPSLAPSLEPLVYRRNVAG